MHLNRLAKSGDRLHRLPQHGANPPDPIIGAGRFGPDRGVGAAFLEELLIERQRLLQQLPSQFFQEGNVLERVTADAGEHLIHRFAGPLEAHFGPLPLSLGFLFGPRGGVALLSQPDIRHGDHGSNRKEGEKDNAN